MNSIVRRLAVLALLFPLPAAAQASNQNIFDTILDTLGSAVSADHEVIDAQSVESETMTRWAWSDESYRDATTGAHKGSDREGPGFSEERPTAPPEEFPSEPGAVEAQEPPDDGNAFDDIFSMLLEAMADGQERAPCAATSR